MISTVNVQHLESLNDAIFELTEIRVRETFPDRILDEADEVVLVDLTPEALQERLRAGKVYPPERAEVALDNFFRADKLSALRELALREVAEDVEQRRSRDDARPAQPAGGRRARARARRAAAEVAADPAPRLALGRSGSAREMDALWVRKPGPAADRGGGDAARRAAPARGRPRRPLPRGGGRRPRRDRPAGRRRARLDLRLRRHARRVAGAARSSAARCSRAWCASCPGIDIRVVANRAERDKLAP